MMLVSRTEVDLSIWCRDSGNAVSQLNRERETLCVVGTQVTMLSIRTEADLSMVLGLGPNTEY